jgi:flagellar protein FlgJ
VSPLGVTPAAAPAPDAAPARPGADPALREAARRFEGLFVTKLLQSALGGESTGGGLFGQGPGSDVYQGLLETFLSDHLSRGGGLGLAESLARTLGEGR